MPLAFKKALAGVLLCGVTTVWVPRLTGYDPFGFMTPQETLNFSEVPSSRNAPLSSEETETSEPVQGDESLVNYLHAILNCC